MAVRFDAAADRLTHSGAYPQTSAGWTVTAWVRIDVDRNDWSTFLRVSDAGTIATIATTSNGTTGPAYYTPTGSVEYTASDLSSPATGVWVPIAATRSAPVGLESTLTVYRRPSGTGTTELADETMSSTDITGTPSNICLGGRSAGDDTEWFNGSIAHVRIWSAELSQSEIEAEWASTTPVRTSGLHSDWPLADATDLTDTVGGKTLATQSGGSPTTTDGPFAVGVSELTREMGFTGSPGDDPTTTDSFTPAAGQRLLVVAGTFESPPVDPGFVDGYIVGDSQELDWTPLLSGFENDNPWAIGAQAWISSPAAASPMTVTVQCVGINSWDQQIVVLGLSNASGDIAGLVTDTDAPIDGAYTVTLSETPEADDAVIFIRHIDNDGSEALSMGDGWTVYEQGYLGVAYLTAPTSDEVEVADTNVTPNGNYKSIDAAFIVKSVNTISDSGEDVAIDGFASAATWFTGPTARFNLCTNPHADVDTSGWTFEGGSLSRVTATGFPKSNAIESGNTTGVVLSAPGEVTPGDDYVVSMDIKPTGALGDAKLYLEWRDSDGEVLDYTSGPTVACPQGVVTRVEMTGTAPEDSVAVALMVAEMFGSRQLGAVLIEPGTVASDYGDGDTSGWSWDGTAGLSSSQFSALQLVVARGLAGDAEAVFGTFADLVMARALAGVVGAASNASGSSSRGRGITGAASAASSARGTLTTVALTGGERIPIYALRPTLAAHIRVRRPTVVTG